MCTVAPVPSARTLPRTASVIMLVVAASAATLGTRAISEQGRAERVMASLIEVERTERVRRMFPAEPAPRCVPPAQCTDSRSIDPELLAALRSRIEVLDSLGRTGGLPGDLASALAAYARYLDLYLHPGKDTLAADARLEMCALWWEVRVPGGFHDEFTSTVSSLCPPPG